MPQPLTALFVDCDSYFASCEQHLCTGLVGLPVAVAPVMAESSCCIAASYEAKAFGVKTGTGIAEARRLCPDLVVVEAQPSEYIRLHHEIVAAVESEIHVEAVLSIDEMWCWLPYNWRERDFVEALGRRIKHAVSLRVSPAIKVSVGIGPNKFLAKLASKMRKPNGLFVIEEQDLPHVLYELELTDLNGISRAMELRLHAVGIHTIADLCSAPKAVLRGAWKGVLGDRYWHLLRGEEIPDVPTTRRSLGHSHVLPPALRTSGKAWPVVCKLAHKASERMRALGLLCGAITLQVGFRDRESYAPELRIPETDSTLGILRYLRHLWSEMPHRHAEIIQVGLVLSRLLPAASYTPDLFLSGENEDKHKRLDIALDSLRSRYGRDVVHLGSVSEAKDSAPMRISFTHIPDIGLEGDGLEYPA